MSSPNGFSFTFQYPDLDDCAVATKGSVRVHMKTRVYSPEKNLVTTQHFCNISVFLWGPFPSSFECSQLPSTSVDDSTLKSYWLFGKHINATFTLKNQHITIIGKWETRCCIDQTGSTSSNAKAALPVGGKSHLSCMWTRETNQSFNTEIWGTEDTYSLSVW